jgi:hypothetical protein
MPGALNLELVLRANAAEFKQGVASAGASLNQLENEARAAGNTIGSQVARGTSTAAADMRRTSTEAINLRGAMGQLGFQAQDMAIQLAAGVNPLMVLGVQGGQAASAFGPLGVAIGTVITLAGVLGGVMFGLGRDTQDAADAGERLDKALSDTTSTLDQYIVKVRGASAEVRELLRLNLEEDLRGQRQEWREAANEVIGLARAARNVRPILSQLFPDEDTAEVRAQVKHTIDQFLAGELGLDKFVNAIGRLRSEAGDLATEELVELDDALRSNASTAAAVQADIEATQQKISLLEGNTAQLTQTTRERAEAEREVAQAQREAAREAEKAAREAAREAEQAMRRRRQLAMSFRETSSFLDRQRDVMKAYDAEVAEADRKGQSLATGLTGGLERAIFATGTLTERMAAFGDEIARVLLRLAVMEPLAQALGAGISSFFAPTHPPAVQTGPGGLVVGGGVTSQVFHSGGVVGAPGAPTKVVDSAAFVFAPRLHRGGMVLGHDEMPAILQRGERVLAKGEQAGALVNVTIVDQRRAGERPQVTERRGANGEREIMVVIRDAVNQLAARGDLDPGLSARFGLRPALGPR